MSIGITAVEYNRIYEHEILLKCILEVNVDIAFMMRLRERIKPGECLLPFSFVSLLFWCLETYKTNSVALSPRANYTD
jgi:hypothetical protein